MSEKITLLLIEDDQNIASFLNAALKGTDYVLAHATSGGEGLNLASTSQPGVILLVGSAGHEWFRGAAPAPAPGAIYPSSLFPPDAANRTR